MLYKVNDFVDAGILKSIHHALFVSHIHYSYIIRGQNVCTINRLFILQKKAFRLIHFKECNAHSAPLLFKSKVVKLPDKIKIENCLFISKYVNNKLPTIFNSWFIFSSTYHNYETSFAAKVHLKILLLLQLHMVKERLLVWPPKHGIILKAKLKIPQIKIFKNKNRLLQ